MPPTDSYSTLDVEAKREVLEQELRAAERQHYRNSIRVKSAPEEEANTLREQISTGADYMKSLRGELDALGKD